MTFFVLLTAVVLVLLAVTIHLGAMHSLNVLLPRWTRFNRFRVGFPVLVAILAHLLEVGLFAIGLGFFFPLAITVSSSGRINLGLRTTSTTRQLLIRRWALVISRRPVPCGFSPRLKR